MSTPLAKSESKVAVYARHYRNKNKKKYNAYQNAYQKVHRVELKIEVLSHYGPEGHLRCCWPQCNVTDVDMLTLDHINNEGAEDRRQRGSSSTFYGKLKALNFPEGYQTLCWNHNCKKEILRRREIVYGRRQSCWNE